MNRVLSIGSRRSPRARRLTTTETAILESDYASGRRNRRRWRLAFAREALVAADALEEGARPRAIRTLCNVVCLEHAIALTGGGSIVARSEMRTWNTFPGIGARRRLEPGPRPLPHGVNLDGMAPGQPTRFEFTWSGQAVDLERRADGWHVVGMMRGGGRHHVDRAESGSAPTPVDRLGNESIVDGVGWNGQPTRDLSAVYIRAHTERLAADLQRSLATRRGLASWTRDLPGD